MAPVSGTVRTAEHDADRPDRHSGLDILLDAFGLLALGWTVALWYVGSPGILATFPHTTFPGFAELSQRGQLTAALIVLTVPAIVVVLVTFGRRPGRARMIAVVPLLAGLLSVGLWRFWAGFVPSLPDGVPEHGVPNTGFWDGIAVSLGIAAVLLLAVRKYRLSRGLVLIATVAVSLSVVATLVEALLTFRFGFGPGDRGDTVAGFAILLPPLLVALVGLAMAPGWLRELWRGDLRSAAALVLWGVVALGSQVLPAYFALMLNNGGLAAYFELGLVPTNGLDWLEGGLSVATAVLIAPVVRAYQTRNQRARAVILAGPVAVLALLLLVRLAGQLIAYRLLHGIDLGPWPKVTDPAEQVIVLFGLIGAGLLLLTAIRPRDRSVPLATLGAAALISVPVGLHVLPEVLRHDPFFPLRNTIGTLGTIVQPLVLWDGGEILMVLLLPWLLLALVTINRLRPGSNADPSPGTADGSDVPSRGGPDDSTAGSSGSPDSSSAGSGPDDSSAGSSSDRPGTGDPAPVAEQPAGATPTPS